MKKLGMDPAAYQHLAKVAGQLEFFSALKGAELDTLLSHLQHYAFDSGETIFRKGEPSEAFYIVHQGQVVIRLGRWYQLFRRVPYLQPGSLFGEMGLLEKVPRSATAVAKGLTQLFVMLRTDFDALVANNPDFKAKLQWLSERRRFEDAR